MQGAKICEAIQDARWLYKHKSSCLRPLAPSVCYPLLLTFDL
jgi:hypothetical protein